MAENAGNSAESSGFTTADAVGLGAGIGAGAAIGHEVYKGQKKTLGIEKFESKDWTFSDEGKDVIRKIHGNSKYGITQGMSEITAPAETRNVTLSFTQGKGWGYQFTNNLGSHIEVPMELDELKSCLNKDTLEQVLQRESNKSSVAIIDLGKEETDNIFSFLDKEHKPKIGSAIAEELGLGLKEMSLGQKGKIIGSVVAAAAVAGLIAREVTSRFTDKEKQRRESGETSQMR